MAKKVVRKKQWKTSGGKFWVTGYNRSKKKPGAKTVKVTGHYRKK